MSKKKLSEKKKIGMKIIIPGHGFRENYLTWQIANCTASTARVFGTIRFIILLIFLISVIVAIIYIPSRLGYYW